MRSEFFLIGGVWSWWVFGDGQGEGGGVDLEVEPVGRLDRVAVDCTGWARSQRISTLTACKVSTWGPGLRLWGSSCSD